MKRYLLSSDVADIYNSNATELSLTRKIYVKIIIVVVLRHLEVGAWLCILHVI